MKKIRILTFWNVPNYGTFMQAYALQRVLESRYTEFEVKHMAYLNKKHFDMYYEHPNNRLRHKFFNLNYYQNLLNRKKIQKEILGLKQFLKYYGCIPNDVEDVSKQKMDVLVLGSDIIWDYSIDFFGQDKYLFGVGINSEKKISYAPSFCTVDCSKGVPNYVIDGLNDLNNISVRDEKSRKIVRELVGKESSIVLDPTLMWNFFDDVSIIRPNIKGKYIVVYGSVFPDKLVFETVEYCKKNNIKLVCLNSLNDEFDWCDITINQDELSPFEWAGFFKYSEAVMTCTYHGLLFSVIFNRKIIFNMTEFIKPKAASFIQDLGIAEPILNMSSFEDKINWSWDYDLINSKLNKLRKESFKYLDDSILEN